MNGFFLRTAAPLIVMVACGGAASLAPHRTTSPLAPAATDATPLVPIATASVSAVPPPSRGAANPRLFADLPAIDPNERYLVDARHVGFSSDDAYLGYEVSRCDPCPTEFHFTSPTKPALDFAYFHDPGNPNAVTLAKRNDAEVDRKLKELGVEKGALTRALRGPFPYPDLVFAVATDRNDVIGKTVLFFGARVEGYAPVFPVHVDVGPSSMFGTPMPPAEQARVAKLPPADRAEELRDWASQWLLRDPLLAYANVTRDGGDIGVVAVATGSMWFETASVARMPVKAFAAQVYNGTGMRFHQASKFAQASALFERAEAADPEDSLFAYNLACAYAQSNDARAQGALTRATARDGAKIKARARGDKDFARVANEAWFKALVE